MMNLLFHCTIHGVLYTSHGNTSRQYFLCVAPCGVTLDFIPVKYYNILILAVVELLIGDGGLVPGQVKECPCGSLVV